MLAIIIQYAIMYTCLTNSEDLKMIDKKIDQLIDNITPALLNCGESTPSDYNDVYKILSNAVQVVKITHDVYISYKMPHSITEGVNDFCLYCCHYDIPMYIMIDNVALVRSIVSEIIK